MAQEWKEIGEIARLAAAEVSEVHVDGKRLTVTHKAGEFGVISGVCNHAGGPLGQGKLSGDYVECPWHYYKFHRLSGAGEPGFEEDRVPAYQTKVEGGRLWVDLASASKRHKLSHPHPLARAPKREEGPIRIVGISTTNMDVAHPRYSTSQVLLDVALEHAAKELGCETKRLDLAALSFRACEGFYSKSAHACTWPCSITQMDEKDQLTEVYEALVHWADVVLVATPIRWGSASSLYFKMIERLNCVQNQLTIAGKQLIKNKVAAFIITGGQDNVQSVAGTMMSFFSEIGFVFPPFPFIAHSRGWSAEDMENNMRAVEKSQDLRDGARALAARATQLAQTLLQNLATPANVPHGGRKAQRLTFDETV